MKTANIPPEVRNQIVNLFSDPVNVTKLQENYEKEKQKIQEQINQMNKTKGSNNNESKVNEQNNKIQNTLENEKQEQ